MKEERELMEAKTERLQAKMEQQRAEAEAERRALEAEMASKLERQRAEAHAKADAAEAQAKADRAGFEARLAQQAKEAESHRQLASLPALQSRLQSLHASKLLTDEELYRLEDVIADSLEDDEGGGSGGQVGKLVALSGRMAGDAALARQLRRKFA